MNNNFPLIPNQYVWCISCERAYSTENSRIKEGVAVCAYENCNCATKHSWTWSRFRGNNEAYPPIPLANRVYSVFPPKLRIAM